MNSYFGSSLSGTRLLAILLSGTFLLTACQASSDEPEPESESAALFDQAVLDLLLESRIQKPASQATSEELRKMVMLK